MKKCLYFIFPFLLSGCSLGLISPEPKQTDVVQITPEVTTTAYASVTISPTILPTTQSTPTMKTTPTNQKVTAILKTSLGDITIELFPDKAPETVANFIGLSDGSKAWTDTKTGKKIEGKPLYNGVIFHRVIKDFMIQGGDPLGTGTGNPGYSFKDEFDPSLTFSEPYMLAMANSGPATNGSQFFITTVPTTWLNNKHTIFGRVISGKEVVDKIESVPTRMNDKPVTDVVIKQIDIVKE